MKLVLVSLMVKGGKGSEMRFLQVPHVLPRVLDSGVRHKLFFFSANMCMSSPISPVSSELFWRFTNLWHYATRERDMEMEHTAWLGPFIVPVAGLASERGAWY